MEQGGHADALLLEEVEKAELGIQADRILKHTQTLSSSKFGGRFPGVDERLVFDYLESQAAEVGLTHGNIHDDSYKQEVPLMRVTPMAISNVHIALDEDTQSVPKKPTLQLQTMQECMIFTSRIEDSVTVKDSELVFCGYGVCCEDQQWDDFAGIDIKGKTIVCLVNDPGFATEDPECFNGRCMTYYGRWTYKFEEAGRKGAAGVLIVHNTAGASYPWHVIENGRGNLGKPYYLLETPNTNKAIVEGWITEDAATRIFKRAGLDFATEAKNACKRGFRPFSLRQRASMFINQKLEKLTSHNFVGLLEGTDPALKDEIIVFTAHWDHLGRKGSDIFHGARDNALGVGALLEIARALKSLPPHKRRRSALFLFTTCEEQILLGSLHYVAEPLFPLIKTVACLNVDVMNIFGRTRDMSYSGKGFSELDDLVEKAANRQRRVVTGEHTPETGTFYRSDHFPFAKSGVPALYLKNGFDHVENGYDWFAKRSTEWTHECYHKPQDVVVTDPTSKYCWDLSGAVEDTRLLFDIASQMIDNDRAIEWKEGAEFRHVRAATSKNVH